MAYSATRAQQRVLSYIVAHVAEHGEAPTYRELQRSLGYKSPNNVHAMVKHLEARGMLKRRPHKSRAIQVLCLPPARYFVFNDETKELEPLRRRT